MIVLLDGPDGVGKSEISLALSKALRIPRFKCETEKQSWQDGTLEQSLWFDFVLPQFVRQTGVSFVGDRGYPSEWVYSQVFDRKTNPEMLTAVDQQFAELGTTIVVLLRRDYSGSRFDELVDSSYLATLHKKYLEFATWTKCRVVKMHVDDYLNDISLQVPVLVNAINGRDDPFARAVEGWNDEYDVLSSSTRLDVSRKSFVERKLQATYETWFSRLGGQA